MTTLVADNESARLQALRRLAILDTPQEARFDRITQIAARVFGTRNALLSLVDEQRVWFKAAHGLELRQIARSAAFCAYAITRDDVTSVVDAAQDARFAAHSLVVEPPHITFYAPVVLRT